MAREYAFEHVEELHEHEHKHGDEHVDVFARMRRMLKKWLRRLDSDWP